jgi:hypothetical protein
LRRTIAIRNNEWLCPPAILAIGLMPAAKNDRSPLMGVPVKNGFATDLAI